MVNTYKQKLTNLQTQILRLLFIKAGTIINQRQIAKLLGVSPPAVMKALPGMVKDGFILLSQDKESKRWSVEANKNNHSVLQLKRVDNLKLIYESGLFEYIEKEFAGAVIILFGSYSRGDDIINSDVDIAIIGRKDKIVNLAPFEYILERKINLNFYDSFGKIHKHLLENLCNGIVLAGGVEL